MKNVSGNQFVRRGQRQHVTGYYRLFLRVPFETQDKDESNVVLTRKNAGARVSNRSGNCGRGGRIIHKKSDVVVY
jgi:hypothetical protein